MIEKNVQEAILRLLAWQAKYHLVDHGYDLGADLKLLLDQFEVVVKGPIVERPWYPEANVSPTSSDHSMDSNEV